MSGLPNFRQIFALSRTPEEDVRVRWTALRQFAVFAAVCAAAALVRDGPPLWLQNLAEALVQRAGPFAHYNVRASPSERPPGR